MSSSDNIKVALAAHFPGTPDKVWKRRSKTTVAGGTERVFENTNTNQMVATIELSDGSILIDGVTYKGKATQAPVAAPVAASTPSPVSAAPVAPKAAPAAPVAVSGAKVERNQMVPGSRWVFDHDTEINLFYETGRGRGVTQVEHFGKVATIRAGTEITILGKLYADNTMGMGDSSRSNGLMAPIEFKDPTTVDLEPIVSSYNHHPLYGWRELQLPFKQIATNISPLEIPETLVYVLRDAATGELFGGWKTEKYSEDMGGGHIYTGTRSEIGTPKMVTKLSSAKKYATSSACKASIREFTGYNEGLEEGDEGGAYYIMGGKKAMDLPPTWEMVEFDKVTGAEKRVIDVQNWLKSLNRLRVLTTTHGSAARAAYKKAEAHADDFPVILIFQNRSVGSSTDYKGGRYSWDEKARFDEWRHGPAAIKAIDAAIKAISGKTLKSKSASAIAVSCQSLTDAIYAKMAFDFDAKDDQAIGITLLDFNTLEEIVEQQP